MSIAKKEDVYWYNREMTRYVMFLLGINVGKRRVTMSELQKVVTDAGYAHVKTILATGNVIFESKERDLTVLKKKLETILTQAFGFEIVIILRTRKHIKELIAKDPFKDVSITLKTRLYVTFLGERDLDSASQIKKISDNDFQIIHSTPSELMSVVTLTDEKGTTEAMNILKKTFGNNITTRNWNTLIKIAKL